jgi:hypothetical protein
MSDISAIHVPRLLTWFSTTCYDNDAIPLLEPLRSRPDRDTELYRRAPKPSQQQHRNLPFAAMAAGAMWTKDSTMIPPRRAACLVTGLHPVGCSCRSTPSTTERNVDHSAERLSSVSADARAWGGERRAVLVRPKTTTQRCLSLIMQLCSYCLLVCGGASEAVSWVETTPVDPALGPLAPSSPRPCDE